MDKKDLNEAFDGLEPSPSLKHKVLSEVNSLESRKNRRKSGLKMRLIAVFAVVVLIIGIAIPIGITLYDDTTELNALSTFKSYAQLKRFIKTNNSSRGNSFWGGIWGGTVNEDMAAAPESDNSESSKGSAPSHSETNTHVKGVDEGDIVKTDGNYIYIVNGAGLTIIDADTLSVEVNLHFESFSPSELYLPKEGGEYTDYIVLTGSYYNEALFKKLNGNNILGKVDVFACECYPYYSHNSTMVKIYSLEKLIAAGADKTESQYDAALINSYEFEYTSLYGTRMMNGVLYLIMNYTNLNYNNFITPAYSQNDNREELPATDITLINRSSSYYTLLMLGTIEIESGTADVNGYVGNGYIIYCSAENLYLAVTEYKNDNSYMASYTRSYNITLIYKFALDQTDISYDGYFKADGYIKDQFSIDEHDGHLRVASTVRESIYKRNYYDVDTPTTGGTSVTGTFTDNIVTIFALDTKSETGRITNLGKENETIYSARFNGDTAVVVTYRQIDPFYVLDLSDPAAPEKVGELEIAGVSDYMQFYSDTLVFTIGRAQGANEGTLSGLKAELYDITDPADPIATSTYTLGNPNDYSYSEATYNYKAIMAYDNIFAFPVVEYSYTYEYTSNGYYYKDTSGYSLNLYLIDELTGTMEEIKIPYNAKVLTSTNYNVYSYYTDTLRRSVIIGTDLYLIGNYGIQRHSIDDIKNNVTNVFTSVEF